MPPAWLREEIIAAGGAIRFERFMDLALHHPLHGYYARRIHSVGRRGDFATTATLSPVLARAIAAWILSQPRLLPIIEVGAGDGSLAHSLRAALPWRVRIRLRHHIVENSAPLAAAQARRLGRRVRWHTSMHDALHHCGGEALIFHNELVDAFPVARWQRCLNQWREIGVSVSPDEQLGPVLLAPGRPNTLAADWLLPEGQIIESHASFRSWLAGWRAAWSAGAMLTIDYGAADPSLYARRPHGTLRGFLLHQRVDGFGIYQNAGRQDLTADVNFADLVRWGSELGLQTTRLTLQAEFLHAHAISATDRALADPRGAGGAFMVLEQRPAPLPG
jgi:SAM-dependent MidA family methyltransferase